VIVIRLTGLLLAGAAGGFGMQVVSRSAGKHLLLLYFGRMHVTNRHSFRINRTQVRSRNLERKTMVRLSQLQAASFASRQCDSTKINGSLQSNPGAGILRRLSLEC